MIVVEPIRNGKYIGDGAYHIALQVWFLNNFDKLNLKDQILVFPYISNPHVQIGYFQNPKVEINEKYLGKIPVVRRDTGGGAIFLDNNSACFCFLIPLNNINNNLIDYKSFYEPAISVLKSMGADKIGQTGKNDLTIENKKVSGAAILIDKNILYGGFSLLYDVDFDMMESVLKINKNKIQSKGIKSIRQRVGKLKDYFADEYKNLTIFEFKDIFLQKFLKINNLDEIIRYELTSEQWQEIDELVKQKYKNYDWVYGLSPRYSYNREKRFDTGTINVSIEIDKGKIKLIKISGDFFVKANKDITVIEKKINWN
nr:lipoate--protein ligase [Mycoplasmopsis cricetuli]